MEHVYRTSLLKGTSVMYREVSFRVLLVLLPLALAGCRTSPPALPGAGRNSNLTPGMVQHAVKVGQTNQTEVLEAFGAPNIITRDKGGQEVWTYDVQSTAHTSATTSKSGNMGAAAGGVAGTVPIVGSLGGSGKRTTSTGMVSSSTFTLIIKFDESQTVADYKMQSTTF